ncbi:ABC transporter permease [Oceanithermus desulfurans]
MKRAPFYLLLPGFVTLAAVGVPLAYLVLRALEADPQTLAGVVFRPRNFALLASTLQLTVGVLVVALLLALPLAWLTTRTDLPAGRLASLIGVLPLAVPGYVTAYALLSLGGPYGLGARVLGVPLPYLNGYLGALIALSLYTYPYFYMNLRSAFLRLDPALEEAARALGHPPLSVFRRVVMPQLLPAFTAGGLLVALHVFADFGVVSLMRYPTFSYAIYLQYSTAYDRVGAAWLALWLLTLTATLLFFEARIARDAAARTQKRPPPKLRLGRLRPLAQAYLVGLFTLSVGLPLSALLYWARAGFARIERADLLEALARSVFASAPAAVFALALALPLAYLGVRYARGAARTLERAAYLGYAVPPLVLALALVFFTLKAVPWLYQTLFVLVYAYTFHFLAEALSPLRAALNQIPAAVEEAARALGSRTPAVFVRVLLPLLRPGLVSGGILVFLSALKELPLTLLLAPIGYDTLAINVWSYTQEAMFAEAAPYALTLLAGGAVFAGLLLGSEGGRR